MFLFLFSILCLSRNLFGSAEKCTSQYGKEFYLGFIHNYRDEVSNLTLDIASTLPGTMYIHVPFLGINRNITIHKESTVVPLNNTLQRLGTFVENRGIYLKSNVDVSVYATNHIAIGDSTDTYLALPVECLGNTYVVTGDTPATGEEESEVMMIGVHDSTIINVTRSNDISVVKTINRLDIFQYASQTDLTNVLITSNKPVAVISGVTFAKEYNMIMSQMQPTASLGKVYIVSPFYPHLYSKLVIINTAKHSNNVCYYDNYNATCNMTVSGDYLQKFDWKSPVVVVANSPVSVTEYTRNDEFMSSVASVDQYLSDYSFVIPGSYSQVNDIFAAVVIPTNSISGLRLDGKMPTGFVWAYTVPQPLSNYTVQVYRISTGYHHMSHVGGVDFGLFCYGYDYFEAFGYLAGIGFATDDCASNPCHNGTCQDGINSYTCSCYVGYTGQTCQINIDECATKPCHNGTCIDGINDFNCRCHAGYAGQTCDIDIDECATKPCHNGTCIDGINDFNCRCHAGYAGQTCDIDIDECATKPCHNGTCIDGINDFNCRCHAGYAGQTCDIDIDECATKPCHNGTCIDGINDFNCRCHAGYAGQTCDIDIDDCSSNLCHNGVCIDRINGYTCSCHTGYTGQTCDTDIDECMSSPCRYGGSCIDGSNSYTCHCAPGYTGLNCQTESQPSPVCFNCTDLSHAGLCDTVQQCHSDEICYLERYHQNGQIVSYKNGCIQKSTCYERRNMTINMGDECVECCTDNYCNNKGCTDSGLPPRDKRGPVCFDCQHVAKPDECHIVQPCQTHEVCAIEEKRWSDVTHYKMGCSSPILCDSALSDDEDLAPRATPICKSCCHDDYCNRNCTMSRNTGSFIIG